MNAAAIIPLGHDSRRDSSSLPDGSPLRRLALSPRELHSLSRICSSSRAGSPLLFGLAPRGVFQAPDIATGTVGSYPTFSPLPNEPALPGSKPGFFEDVSQVFLRDATALLRRRYILCGTFRN